MLTLSDDDGAGDAFCFLVAAAAAAAVAEAAVDTLVWSWKPQRISHEKPHSRRTWPLQRSHAPTHYNSIAVAVKLVGWHFNSTPRFFRAFKNWPIS